MSWIWILFLGVSLTASLFLGTGEALSAAVIQGAQQGVTLALSLAGSICLWTGVGKVMERSGITDLLSRLLMPLLGRIFPSCRKDRILARSLSANVCANFLGLGNAATPMGIDAAKRLAKKGQHHQLCRLIVLNTASIQLIPTTVAAVRASLGCPQPFDILPAVWLTSIASAGMGLFSAFILGRLWRK